VFENRVLRKIFGPKGDGATGEWRRLHSEELDDVCCSVNIIVGRDSSVGMATRYGLDGPGIESRFSHLSRPALGPTHAPVQ
jgi:hypothetical protein